MLDAANDVFQKDDGIIDEEADGERHSHQGEIVNGITEPPHGHESDEEGHRQRHHRNDRVAGATQKNEDDENHEDKRKHKRELHVMERVHDRLRAVEDRDQLNRSGQFPFQLRQQLAHGLRYCNGVSASLPRNGKHDNRGRRIKTTDKEMPREAFVLNAIDDLRDVAQINGRSICAALHD